VSIEGELKFELLCRDQHIQRVRIRSSRPLQLPLLFEGKRAEEVLHMIPMLYSVCATAQASAAALACRQALGLGVERGVVLAESMLVWLETAREHLWRILIDWPGVSGEAVDREQVAALSRLIPQGRQSCFGEQGGAFTLQPSLRFDGAAFGQLIGNLTGTMTTTIFGMLPSDWYAMNAVDDFHHWIESGTTPAARHLAWVEQSGLGNLGDAVVGPLPEIDAASLDRRLQQADADRFVTAPDWGESPCETSPLTRQLVHPLVGGLRVRYGSGLLTRLAARLLELASIPGRLQNMAQILSDDDTRERVASEPMDSGVGLGTVEAARGRLTHRATLAGGVVSRYQILAPTEWNFHPQGVVACGLIGFPCGDETTFSRQAELFIKAVDPCVGYRLEFA
jgi:hypothetical protein